MEFFGREAELLRVHAPRRGEFAAERVVTARFTGVLMPGWDECGACVEGFTAYERPFDSGTLYFKDGTTAYSYPIDVKAALVGE